MGDKGKKNIIIGFILGMCLLISSSSAELSTNLQVRTTVNRTTGLTESVTYVDGEGNPVTADDKGYATVQYTYTTNSKISKTVYLDENGELVNNTDGYAQKMCTYNSDKNPRTTEYRDAEGNAVTGPEGYARQVITYLYGKHQSTWEYDPEGNPVNLHRITEFAGGNTPGLVKSDSWYDAEGNPAAGPNGYARVEYEHRGTEVVRTSYYNAGGELYLYAKAGYAVKALTYENGRMKALDYYGADGEPAAGPEGYAHAEYSYINGDSNVKRTMFYNADGSPYFTEKGYCGIQQSTTTKGVVTDESYFIGEDLRGYCKDGYSRVTKQYTVNGKLGIQSYYDDQDRLMYVASAGYAAVRHSYVGKTLIRTEYYDEYSKPMPGPEGYFAMAHIYLNGVKTETVYYDTDGSSLINSKKGYARITYQYDKDGNYTSKAYFDQAGNRFIIGNNADEYRYEWADGNQISESYWANGEPVLNENGIHEIRTEYNGKGKAILEQYYDTEGDPVLCTDGYAGIGTQYNSSGKVMATLYYDEAGNLTTTPGKEYAYVRTIPAQDRQLLEGGGLTGKAEDGEQTVYIEYFDTDGELMNLKSGYAVIVRQLDGAGRNAGQAYFDRDGNKVLLADGYHSYTRVNDEDGFAVSMAYFGLDGEPVASIKNKYHRIDRTYWNKDHYTSEAWFDENGEPMALDDTYVRIEREFDEKGNAVIVRTYGADGEKIARKAGYDEIHQAFNEQNKVILADYLLDGKPVALSDGYARKEIWYDEQGNKAATLYYDVNLELMNTPGKKYAYELTTAGDGVKTISYYGTDRELMNLSGGYAVIVRQLDENGGNAGQAYFDKDGNKVLLADGYHSYTRVNGEDGFAASMAYFGLEREPVINTKTKYHRIDRTYWNKDHYTSEAWFGTDGEPMTLSDTYVRIEREFDENGNTTVERTYGADGGKIARKAGYDEIHQEFNEQNKVICADYFLDGKPVALSDGYARKETWYDEQGNKAATLYYDENLELMTAPGKEYAYELTTAGDGTKTIGYYGTDGELMNLKAGYAVIVRQLDEAGRNAGQAYFDRDVNKVLLADGYHSYTRVNGEDGFAASMAYFGLDGEPVINTKTKYHRIDRTYWNKDHYTSEAWFDENDEPMTNGNTYVRIEREFDEKGNAVVVRTYGADGEKIARKAGYDEIHQEFNEQNKASRIEYYLDGEPYTVKQGYAAVEREYDSAGNITYERYFGKDGKPMTLKQGYAAIRKEYDEEKRVVYEAWFDMAEQPTAMDGDVYCAIRREYDENGRANVLKYYGADGNPACCEAGYEMVWLRFDDKDQVNYESYMNHNGEPMANVKGVYQTTYDYDEKGRLIREFYFDRDGQRMKSNEGYQAKEWEYDGNGVLSGETGLTFEDE